jgi:hypothetical protein
MIRSTLFRAISGLGAATALTLGFAAQMACADGDAPCAAPLRNQLKIAGALPDVCLTSARLVPGRMVVLALWSTTPDSPPEIPFAAVLDRKALETGRREYLYKRRAMGESLAPFLFNGKTVNAAVADFDGSGRIGWGMWVVPDADYSYAITAYDPGTRKFVDEASFVADDLDAMVEVTRGQILVPICDASGGTPSHPAPELYFDVYRLKGHSYEKGERVPAAAASAAERTKCRKSGQ